VSVQKDDEGTIKFRIADSYKLHFSKGLGDVKLTKFLIKKTKTFSDRLELDGMIFELPLCEISSPLIIHLAPAKPVKEFGNVTAGIDPDLVPGQGTFRL